MNIFIKSWKAGSMGAKELRNAVGGKLIRNKDSRYVNDPNKDLVINWGDSKCPNYAQMLNRPDAVKRATSKLTCAKVFEEAGVSIPPTYYSKAEVELNVLAGATVFCRGLINSSKGKGIVVARTKDELIDCKLYTVGITDPDRIEYRIHVFQGKVIHQQQKKKRNGWEDNPNFSDEVRNLKGGWIFAIQNVNASEHTKNASIKAVEALGLDFGGVDIVQTSDGTGYVIEVNTACGLHGTTIVKYQEAVKACVEGL